MDTDRKHDNQSANQYLAAQRDTLLRDIARLRSDDYRLQAEIRGFMPKQFIEAYRELCDDIFKSVSSGLGSATDMPQAPRSNKKGKHDGGMKGNSTQVNRRKNVDRRLRAIARDIRSAGKDPIRCPGCSKYIEERWAHCAWCGKELNHE